MKRNRKSINALAAARARLGFTQEHMALELGVSTSMVKLVETNRRMLNSEKLVMLASLELQLAIENKEVMKDLPPSMKEIYKQTNNDYELETSYQEMRCRQKAKQLEKRLQKMQLEHEQVKVCLHNLDAMSSLQLRTEDSLVRNLLLNRPRLFKKLTTCNLQLQEMTKKKIALLYAEAALFKSIHPDYVHKNEKPIFSPLKQTNMDYTVSLISNRADCQEMIDIANDDKDSLAYRRTGLQRQKQNASTNTVSIEADLATATAELSALQTIFDNLPDGDAKEDTRVRIKKVEYKKFLLEERKTSYGSVALIGKEYDIACIEQSIAETDAFITALTTRMNELPPA